MVGKKHEGLQDLEKQLNDSYDKHLYDPHQSASERRDLRKSYRDLHDKTLQNRRNLTAQDNGEGLYSTLVKSNVLFANVKNTQEAVLDSRFLVLTADLNTQKVKGIDLGTDSDVNLDDLVSKIISSGRAVTDDSSNELDWESLGKMATQYGKRAHTMDFILGPLGMVRKEIKRQASSRLYKNKNDIVVPQQLKEGDIQKQENETSNNVNHIMGILTQAGPTNYFKFVTNPESFSQTVENIFYVSFLIREGVAGIDIVNGQPILGQKTKSGLDDSEEIVNKKQIIMGIDISDFNEIIKTYNVTSSYIPTRETKDPTVVNGRGWY